jgi:hypothetical protein
VKYSASLYTPACTRLCALQGTLSGADGAGSSGAAGSNSGSGSGGQLSADDVEPVHTTDTDSIRRRYTSLEKGPRSAKEPMFTDYKSLFKPNLIIEFGEDSPR